MQYVCQYCNREFFSKTKFRKYCSVKCFSNSRIDSVRTAHVVKRVCEWCKCEFEVVYKLRNQRFCCASHARKKSWNLGLTTMTSTKLRETIEKSNATKAMMIVNGTWSPKTRGKSSVHVSPKAGQCWSRSTYEKRFFEMLDANDSVDTYVVEPFSILFTAGATKRRYVPDVLVTYSDGTRELVEVKPQALVNLPINIAKRLAAEEWCTYNSVKYVLVTEHELAIKNKSTT